MVLNILTQYPLRRAEGRAAKPPAPGIAITTNADLKGLHDARQKRARVGTVQPEGGVHKQRRVEGGALLSPYTPKAVTYHEPT